MSSFLFGTVGSPISSSRKPGGTISGIIRTAELGLECLELGWVHSVSASEETCHKIRKEALARNVLLSVHAPYYINLNANDEEWENSSRRLIKAATLGFLAGATDIIFHPGSYFQQAKDVALKRAISRLTQVSKKLNNNNIQVILRPETMGKQTLIGSLLDVLILSQEVTGVQPCLDLAHLHARKGDGSLNNQKSWESMLETYTKFLGEKSLQSLHIHLSGIEYSQRGEKKHLPVQESDLDFRAIFRALINFDCSGRILCESPRLEEDAIYLKDTYHQLL